MRLGGSLYVKVGTEEERRRSLAKCPSQVSLILLPPLQCLFISFVKDDGHVLEVLSENRDALSYFACHVFQHNIEKTIEGKRLCAIDGFDPDKVTMKLVVHRRNFFCRSDKRLEDGKRRSGNAC